MQDGFFRRFLKLLLRERIELHRPVRTSTNAVKEVAIETVKLTHASRRPKLLMFLFLNKLILP